jgi:hypothetical protein
MRKTIGAAFPLLLLLLTPRAAFAQAEARDTVPVEIRRFVPMGRCMADFVVDGPEALARLRALPNCADAAAGLDLRERALVPVRVHNRCGSTRLRAHRLERERVVRLHALWIDGMCRMVSASLQWVAVPLPPGFRVEVSHSRVDARRWREGDEPALDSLHGPPFWMLAPEPAPR